MLGGRAAEEIVYGTQTTGAENDIEQATDLARNMVTRWGMSDELGMVQLAPRAEPVPRRRGELRRRASRSAKRPRASIDAEVQRIIDESHDEAKRAARASIASSSTRWSQALLARETLDEQEILEVTGLPPAPELETRRAGLDPRDRARHRAAPPRPRRLRGRPRAAVRAAAAWSARSSSSTTWARSTFPPASRARVDVRPHPHIGLADRHVPVRGRDHAPRQRGLGAGDPPRRGELDDRRPRHHALRALRARAPRRRSHARHPGLGRAAATRTRRPSPASTHHDAATLPRSRKRGLLGRLDRRRGVRRARDGADALADVLRALAARARRARRAARRVRRARALRRAGRGRGRRPDVRAPGRCRSSRRAHTSRCRPSSPRS